MTNKLYMEGPVRCSSTTATPVNVVTVRENGMKGLLHCYEVLVSARADPHLLPSALWGLLECLHCLSSRRAVFDEYLLYRREAVQYLLWLLVALRGAYPDVVMQVYS